MNNKLIENLLSKYNEYINEIDECNKILGSRKIRKANFPSEISENIARIAINKKFKIESKWDIKSGDLKFSDKKIEVKSFSSIGPTSFGPTEKWNYICFVDSTKHRYFKFKVYFLKISNISEVWQNIKINKEETYKCQCEQGRRPRIKFSDIRKQLNDKKIYKIFDGFIYDLLK